MGRSRGTEQGQLGQQECTSNASTVNKGAGQPSRDGLRMSCDCDARGGRETPRQTVFNSMVVKGYERTKGGGDGWIP